MRQESHLGRVLRDSSDRVKEVWDRTGVLTVTLGRARELVLFADGPEIARIRPLSREVWVKAKAVDLLARITEELPELGEYSLCEGDVDAWAIWTGTSLGTVRSQLPERAAPPSPAPSPAPESVARAVPSAPVSRAAVRSSAAAPTRQTELPPLPVGKGPFIDPKDLTIWIHTCPQRLPYLDILKNSLHRSDVGDRYEIHICEAKGGLGVEAWRREKYKEMSERTPWHLMLEDDIVVNRHLLHNVTHWPATLDPMYGIGLLFTFSMFLEDPQYRIKRRLGSIGQSFYLDVPLISGAQAVLHKSVVTAKVARRLPHLPGRDLDDGVTDLVYEMGLRTYLHHPSLAQVTEVSGKSALKHSSWWHPAINWDPNYRRPDGETTDQSARALGGEMLTMFTTTWMNEVIGVQVNPTSLPKSGPVLAVREGQPLMVKAEHLYPLYEQAAAEIRARRAARRA